MTVPVGADFEHGARLSTTDNHPDIHLSAELKEFLLGVGESTEVVLRRPLTVVPEVDDSYPLPSYFISSSHNTYLLSNQLWGSASAIAYTHVVGRHGRCVEIDAWDSPNGPKVTHGYTLTDRTTFRDVCEAILSPVKDDNTHWPVLISLECHASHETQLEMVKIMKEVFGAKLVDSALEHVGDDRKLTPRDIRGRILVIVEWHAPKSVDDADSSSSSSDEDDKPGMLSRLTGRKEQTAKKQLRPPICPELSALGLYANSIKVHGDFTSQNFSSAPLNRLINISESALLKLLPNSLTKLIQHGTQHLCRVYPKGTRVGSANLNPLKYWRAGSQIAARNWQNYDRGMQLNNAMFDGTNGWVLKPSGFLGRDTNGALDMGSKGKVTLIIDIVGASNLPRPDDVEPSEMLSTYVRAELMHSQKKYSGRTKTSKGPAKDGELGMNPMWKGQITWEYEDEPLVFMRLMVVEDKFGIDEPFGVVCVKTEYLQTGWRLAKILDLSGSETGSTLLLHISIAKV